MTLLTIAHATYNNHEKFLKTANSIVDQIKGLDNVEFLVLDDSTNNFSKKQVEQNFINEVTYFKKSKQNIDYAYLWLMKKLKENTYGGLAMM